MQRLFASCCNTWLATFASLAVSVIPNLTAGAASPVAALRLVPFPKEITLQTREFDLTRPLILEVSQEKPRLAAEQIGAELSLAGIKPPAINVVAGNRPVLRLLGQGTGRPQAPALRPEAGPEDYALEVRPEGVAIEAKELTGVFHGVQTLRQLIRANRQGDRLPCLTIRDWPSLRWRAFQDDLTRGPSSTLAELKREAALGAFFKQNIFTYYMEHQYAFSKHPVIGPTDGSLTPAELAALVSYSEPLQLNILGNQQSFGHFGGILGHPEYAALRETPDVLCPTNARTYQLLDDLYSEVAPLLPFPFFNVCCDETDGLGQGPSKPVAEKIGVGGLYVQHIQRIHDLVKNKYHKRMMMWGDIILRHPQNLEAIPKDTIMLSWGYDPRGSFEDQITPFAKSGYEFFVCPGVNCWNRVLPHFRDATINIRNFVRDGIKHGALGMLNTAWDDDGETFNAPNWHGIAWGAECSWNASATAPEDFNRRIGAVLFGEKGDHFGKAIERLSTPEICGLPDGEFGNSISVPVKPAIRPPCKSDGISGFYRFARPSRPWNPVEGMPAPTPSYSITFSLARGGWNSTRSGNWIASKRPRPTVRPLESHRSKRNRQWREPKPCCAGGGMSLKRSANALLNCGRARTNLTRWTAPWVAITG